MRKKTSEEIDRAANAWLHQRLAYKRGVTSIADDSTPASRLMDQYIRTGRVPRREEQR